MIQYVNVVNPKGDGGFIVPKEMAPDLVEAFKKRWNEQWTIHPAVAPKILEADEWKPPKTAPIFGRSVPCIRFENGDCSCFTAEDHHKDAPIFYSAPRCEDWPNATYEVEPEPKIEEAGGE